MNWLKAHWGWFAGAIGLFILWRLYSAAQAATAAAQQSAAAQADTNALTSLLPTTAYPSTVYSATDGYSANPSNTTSSDTTLASILSALSDQNKAATSAATSTVGVTSTAENTLVNAAAQMFATQSTDSGYINQVTGQLDPATGMFSLTSRSDVNPSSVGSLLYGRLASPAQQVANAAAQKQITTLTPGAVLH